RLPKLKKIRSFKVKIQIFLTSTHFLFIIATHYQAASPLFCILALFDAAPHVVLKSILFFIFYIS
ncbi:MAG: hypothetical protein EAZ29_12790, partial [Runella slithyformis]